MERRLHRYIMTPAMVASWVLGIALIWIFGLGIFEQGWWLTVKLALVLCLTAFHIVFVRHAEAFATDRNVHSERYFRMINEAPTLLMIGIVVMVIVRPF
jgi:putative membrane protein